MAGIGAISAAEDEIEKAVRRFTEKGLVTEEEARRIIREFLGSIEKSKVNIDKKIEENIMKVLNTLSIPSSAEVKELNKKVMDLEKKLEALIKTKKKKRTST